VSGPGGVVGQSAAPLRRASLDRGRDAAVVFAVALAARLAVVAWAHARFPPAEDGHYYDLLARRLAAGAGYTWLWPDGAVTYAALYPVGYPALLGVVYTAFGVSPAAAMLMNAVLGAAAAYGVHRLVDDDGVARWRPAAAGLAVALHPALVPYTAAVMTEGAAMALTVVAAAFASSARGGDPRRARVALGCAAVVMGVAVLVRPQTLAIAPVLGALGAPPLAGWRRRALQAAGVTAVALACVAPWTARNCVRMHRCALVSVNGGWNLLIGTATTTGGWQPVEVPAECATVWDEAAKDTCFGRAARRVIAAAPGAWLGRVPGKLAMTFDYFGAGGWYLHASAPDAFDDSDKVALGAVETLASRLLLLGALVVVGLLPGRRAGLRKGVALAGAAAAVTLHGWIGYVAVAVCAALQGRRVVARGPVLVGLTAGVVLATAGVHAAFFGAGRYGIAVVPFVAGLAFVPPRGS
jgi:hypothetical protein